MFAFLTADMIDHKPGRHLREYIRKVFSVICFQPNHWSELTNDRKTSSSSEDRGGETRVGRSGLQNF